MQGIVTKGIGGFYYVAHGGEMVQCKACGRFRIEKVSPLVGDHVVCEMQNGEGYITEVLPRKNCLVRPAVANVDRMLIVISAQKPKPDLMLLDKLLLQARREGISPLLVINKSELQSGAKALAEQYQAVCNVLVVSAKTGTNLDALKQAVKGKTVVLAGQSAVGKSSLINLLDASLLLETGELSKKTQRGKHTTRQATLLHISSLQAYVMDTPGFSMFELSQWTCDQIQYSEFAPFLKGCRYPSCMHDKEPDCAVKQAVQEGSVHAQRYERYLKLLQQVKQAEERIY